MGENSQTIARYILGSTASEIMDAYLIQRDTILVFLKNNSLKTQTRMMFVNKHCLALVFAVSYWHFLKLNTLGRQYFGPFKVTQRI